MGNQPLKAPKVEKITDDGENSLIKYGMCEMQGWRNNMEDATLVSLDYEQNSSIFGVFDGHGGSIISQFVASNFLQIMTMMKSYQNKNYEQALIETILKFDELLRNEKINEYLKHYSKRRVQNNNSNFNLELMSSENTKGSKENIHQNISINDIDENNIDNNNNNISEKTENNNNNNEKEIANFDNEFHKICEKIKDENEIFPLTFDDKMKMKIIESDFDGILDYFNGNLIESDESQRRKPKNSALGFSRSQTFDRNYSEIDFKKEEDSESEECSDSSEEPEEIAEITNSKIKMRKKLSHETVRKASSPKGTLDATPSLSSRNKLSSIAEIRTDASTIDSYSINSSEKEEINSVNILKENELSSQGFKEPMKLVAFEMGTTANIILIKNNYLYIANVGDSLAVMYKNGLAEKLTTEHKVSLEHEKSRIEKSGARIINNRIEGRLNLTRAIGDLTFKNKTNLEPYEQAVISYPEITKLKLTDDIEFVIIACDGIWDCVDIQKFCEHVSQRLKKSANKKISKMIGELFDQMISKTNNTPIGTDNMSCIIVQLNRKNS